MSACIKVLIVGAFLRVVAAVIDNDVLGIFKLSYRPQHLAARIIVAVEYLISMPALLVLVGLAVLWGIRRMGRMKQSDREGDVMGAEQSITDERGYPHIWREPRRWRRYQYGKHRVRAQNLRAWFFADRYGRRTLRELRQIKRQIRRDREGRP